MSLYALAFLIGVIAGLRFADGACGAQLGGASWVVAPAKHRACVSGLCAHCYLLSVLAIVELVGDKLPKTRTAGRRRVLPPGWSPGDGAAFGAAGPSRIGGYWRA
jgi:uncharacterized membrane protein